MTNGRCVAERDPELCDVAELQRLMLGRELSTAYDKISARPSTAFGRRAPERSRPEPSRGSYEAVSFDLHAGEVLGLAGVQGSGREALCRTLFGAEGADGGEFLIDGAPVRFNDPAERRRAWCRLCTGGTTHRRDHRRPQR